MFQCTKPCIASSCTTEQTYVPIDTTRTSICVNDGLLCTYLKYIFKNSLSWSLQTI